jgi:hypothetical protein
VTICSMPYCFHVFDVLREATLPNGDITDRGSRSFLVDCDDVEDVSVVAAIANAAEFLSS